MIMAATTNKGFGLLFEMGCGKTRTAIAIAGAAYQKGAIQRVLVIAPTSVVSVWPKEIAEVADFKVTCKALLGTKQQRIRMIEDLQAFPFKALKVAVINYESTWRDGLFEKLQEYDADLIICDESQRIKTHDAEQSKDHADRGGQYTDGNHKVLELNEVRPAQKHDDRRLQQGTAGQALQDRETATGHRKLQAAIG